MQCPACNHEDSVESFGDPARCPACGVYYEKALALKQRREQAEQGQETPERPASKLKSAWLGAKVSVEEGRRRRVEEERNRERARSLSSASPVVVTDVQIQFGSMVTLLVKLAFAAIPAAIIVTIIVWGVASILGLLPLLLL